MSLTNHAPLDRDATQGQPVDLMPLLRTAKRVKRSLTPVRPSLAFQSALEDELIVVARRLAMSRGNAPRTVVCGAGSASARGNQVAAVYGGLAVVFVLAGLGLLVFRARRRQQSD